MDQDEQQNDVITIVLTADNHLGYTVPGHYSRKREALRQRLRRAFQQATDFAIGQGVDLFVQVGDLFNSPHPDEQDRNFVAARLAELKQAGVRAYAVGGVHDTPAESRDQQSNALLAPHASFARLGALHYFPPYPEQKQDGSQHTDGSSTLRPVLVDVRGTLVAICGLGVVAGQQDDPLAGVRVDTEIERAALSLLLLSAPIEGTLSEALEAADAPDTQAQQSQQAQVSQASITTQSAFHTILAGYMHRHQRLTIGQTEVVIAGATQHVEYSESNGLDAAAGFVFLGIAADGIRWCRHIDIESIQMRRLVLSTAELWPDTELDEEHEDGEDGEVGENGPNISPTERILDKLRPLCTQETIVQLRLEGELSRRRYHQLKPDALRRYGEAHAFAFLLDDSALTFSFDDTAQEPLSSALSAVGFEERLSPREELIALADEWIVASQDEQEKTALLATKEELLSALWSTTKA